MARTTWSGPTTMDLSILAKDAVCHVCGRRGHFARDCWHQSGRGSGKGKKARKAKSKAQNPRMGTPSRKVLAVTVARSVTLHVNVRGRKKQAMASSSGVHCLTYTDDQSHWIMMLAEGLSESGTVE